VTIEKYVDRVVDDLTNRVEDSLKDAKERVDVASKSLDKRVDLLNELRGNVASTEEVEALEKRVVALEKQDTGDQGVRRGIGTSTTFAREVLMVVIAVVAVIVTLYVARNTQHPEPAQTPAVTVTVPAGG
jgi:hypothetical protein